MKHRFAKTILGTLAALALVASAHANVVAYWRFEGGDFLADSSGNNHALTNVGSVDQVASAFPNPVPQTGAANLNAASFDGSNYFTADDHGDFTSNQFTLEAFFSMASDPGTATRVIAGHFGSDEPYENQRSYALGVRGGQLRVLMSSTGEGNPNQRIWDVGTVEVGTNYYAAMAVDIDTTSLTMYLQDLSTDTLDVFTFSDTLSALNQPTAPFTIGSTAQGGALWDGTIDEVRLSNAVLTQDQLLIIPEPGVVGLMALFGAALLVRRRLKG